LWLGIAAGNSELETLAKGLERELERLGWLPDERPFRAHLTLARADGRREGPAAARLLTERARILDETFRANRLVLFESVTGGGPARYEPLHVAALRGTA
jgi:2'-5' RNA ligase